MTPYIARCISFQNKELFVKIQFIVRHLPDLDLGIDEKGREVLLSCHMIARAIGKVLGLQYVDGVFCQNYAHSWLLSPDQKCIIDCYPVGMLGGPLLINAQGLWYQASPGRKLYRPSKKIGKNILFGSTAFRRSVRRLEREIKQIIAKY